MKKLKIIYTEGCFDELSEEMTQEELDALTAEIEALANSGELFQHAKQLSNEESEIILSQLNSIEKNTRQ